MKATYLRAIRGGQPTCTLTLMTGSSISLVVVTRSSRSVGSARASTLTRTSGAGNLLSPTKTSAETHSALTLSSASSLTETEKFSAWPSTVVSLTRPKPSAMALVAASHKSTPAAKRMWGRCMREVGLSAQRL